MGGKFCKIEWERSEFRKQKAAKNRILDFQKTGILKIRTCPKHQSTFAPKFLLASSPDSFVECLLVTCKIAALFQLQTENLSKASETFWLTAGGFGELQNLSFFRRMALKNTHSEKTKATDEKNWFRRTPLGWKLLNLGRKILQISIVCDTYNIA